jgi:putative exosortase-associated protein (TIGR04073 family)
MKKIICVLMVFMQLSFILSYAEVKNTPASAPKTNFEPKNKAKTAAGQPTIQIIETPEKPGAVAAKKGNVLSRIKFSELSPLRKIARGAANTTLGWLEIPRQTIKVNKEKGDIAGAFWGPLKGFAYFVGRTAVGIYEVTTFLLPPYKAAIEPEFIFSDEDDD